MPVGDPCGAGEESSAEAMGQAARDGAAMSMLLSGGGERTAMLPVPDETVSALVEEAAKSIARAVTIPDVMRLSTAGRALAAWTRAVRASKEAQAEARKLEIRAEVRLGKLCSALPKARRGQGEHHPRKGDELKSAGVCLVRASAAERLAKLPPAKVSRAIEACGDRPSLTGVRTKLGIIERRPNQTRTAVALARDCVALLRALLDEARPPLHSEVAALGLRFAAIEVADGRVRT